jgi:FemAB-related protein (PEP-CTERM system-associated)
LNDHALNGSGQVTVAHLDAGGGEEWDAYVRRAPGATFFHLAGWREIVEGACGHRAHYLAARRGGRIVGVLPLAHQRSLLFGNALISTPFCVYGGAVADDPAAQHALLDAAEDLARDLRVDYLELRNLAPVDRDWPTKQLYVTFRKPITGDAEKDLNAIPRKQRAMVRKGIDAGLEAGVDEDVGRFFEAYSESVRNLGTPVLGKGYFAALRRAFGSDCEVLTVTRGAELVASVMSFYFRDEVLPYYGGGTAAARACKGNDFMYWELMRRAGERGVRLFDYGRSKRDTGSFSFKEHWGFVPQDLHYQYCLVRARSMPDLSPKNPKYHFFIEAWKRLPLPVARTVGPAIARRLG